VLIFCDFCGFISIAYTTLNKLLAVFFIYNWLIRSANLSGLIALSDVFWSAVFGCRSNAKLTFSCCDVWLVS